MKQDNTTAAEIAQEIASKADCHEMVREIEVVLDNAASYTVINDGAVRYAVRSADLAAWEAKNGDISVNYDEFCGAVPYALTELGTPGNIGQIELAEALRELGASTRSF